MKIVFFGTSEFAVPALQALQSAGFDLTVVTMPDQPAGRKKILTPSPVKQAAENLGLTVLQPASLKDDGFFAEFASLAPDFAVVAAYGKFIPDRYIQTPKHAFLNIHPSLLPKYRGPTPVQAALLNGETETGVTIMQIDKEMDHGPIYLQKKFDILPDETYPQLHDRLAHEGATMLLEIINNFSNFTAQEQDHSQTTFCKIYTREDARIDWSKSHQEIYNQIRALNPEPGTWTIWQDKILNIKSATLENNQLKIKTLQLEGKKETSFSEFLHGHPDFKITDLK
jgi:methionyl-tRNA formyltransferase